MRIAGTLQLDGSTIALNQAGNSTTLTSNSPAVDITITLPPTTDTLVGRATTDTLTNKTLTGNTLANSISGSGTTVYNTTGTITIPNGTDTLVGKDTTDTLTNKTLTSPTITSPTITGASTLSVVDNGTSDLIFASSDGAFTVDRTLSFDLNDADRAVNLAGDLTLAGSLTTSGAYATTLTATAATNVTLPTTGTLSTLAGSETLTNKTLTTPLITAGGSIDVTAAGTLSIAASAGANNITLGGSSSTVVIAGNLQVDGTTTSVNSTTMDVTDSNITVNNGGNQASADSNDAGLTVEMSDATDAVLHYDSTATSLWKAGASGSTAEVATISHTQTLTNKTLTGNTLANSISGSGTTTYNTTGTITLPNATDTLVGKDTADTLTNKTLTNPTINAAALSGTFSGTPTFSGDTVFSSTGAVTLPSGTTAQQPTPTNGMVRYNSESSSFEGYAGGAWGALGGGSSGINYIENSDAETDTTGYTNGTEIAITRVTTGTVLRGDASFSITTTASVAADDEAYYTFVLDEADANRLLAISFDFADGSSYASGDLEVYIVQDPAGTPVDITPSQVVIPGGTGKFEATWVSGAAGTYALAFRAVTATTVYEKRVDNVRVGPDQAVFGPSVGEYQSFNTTPKVLQGTGGSEFGTYTHLSSKYKRTADSANLYFKFTSTADNANANAFTAKVYDFTFDTSKFSVNNVVGYCRYYDSSATTTTVFPVYLISSSELQVYGASATLALGSFDNGDIVEIITQPVPIAEWAGDVTHLAAARVEYAYSTNTTTTAGNTQTDDGLYGYGPAGTAIVAIGSSTASSGTQKRVRFQTTIQETDLLVLETKRSSGVWMPVTSYGGLHGHYEGTGSYGMTLERISGSTTDIYVTFGNAGASSYKGSAKTYGELNTDPWSGYTAYNWRVRKSSPHAPAGIQLATSSVPGLLEQKTKWQRKYLSGDVTTAGTMSSLTFNGLVTGKTYRVTLNCYGYNTGSAATEYAQVDITHNSAVIGAWVRRHDVGTDLAGIFAATVVIFTAAASTLTFVYVEAGTGTISGNGGAGGTNAILEELGSYEESTAFT